MNIKEASAYTGFSVHTLYGWTSQRRIPFIKKGGRLRFDKWKLDEWMREDSHEPCDTSDSGW